jgi:hypothetical protein
LSSVLIRVKSEIKDVEKALNKKKEKICHLKKQPQRKKSQRRKKQPQRKRSNPKKALEITPSKAFFVLYKTKDKLWIFR